MNQINILYILNLHNVICILYFNKRKAYVLLKSATLKINLDSYFGETMVILIGSEKNHM